MRKQTNMNNKQTGISTLNISIGEQLSVQIRKTEKINKGKKNKHKQNKHE